MLSRNLIYTGLTRAKRLAILVGPQKAIGLAVKTSASFSACRRYRYALWRNWADLFPNTGGSVMFIGLNPSTADETHADEIHDDPTIRRCIAFAQAWGFQELYMTNLFAYRTTKIADLLTQTDPIGED
jgi:hypothetical protein